MTQISVSGVGVEFGPMTLLDDVTFTVARGERWGIIGRNGTGKTTLFEILIGGMSPTRGTVTLAPGLRLTMLEQHREFAGASTVWEAAAGPFAELLSLERSLEAQAHAIGAAGNAATPLMLDRYARDLERFQHEDGYAIAPRIDAVLQGLGFDPDTARTQRLETLSGGERGRLGLARQLVAPADVLLLDEPTNHLDLETTRWLEEYLRAANVSVMLISHDRAFLDALVDHVLHLEGHTAVAYSGSYAGFVQQRADQRLSQQRAYDKQRRTIADEEEYIRRNIAGQNSRQAKGRRKRLDRLPRLSPVSSDDEAMALRLHTGSRGGDQVLVAEDVQVAVGDRILVDGFTARLMRGDVVGLVGPNGAGKSTLLGTLLGERASAAGVVRVGGSITIAHYRQDMAQVPTDQALYDIIAHLRPAWERRRIQGHLARFGFSGDSVQRRAATLSGGERARVALAMMVLQQANLLVLDEPTNHLDVESIEALEDALEGYDGSVLLVSHDRALLRALTTRVWVLHGGRITVFDGPFAEWEIVSEERAQAAAIAAAEAEAIRREREHQRVRMRARVTDAKRGDARQAHRDVEELEARAAELESRLAELTATLADPELYVTPDGSTRAHALGRELEELRSELDRVLNGWAAAVEAMGG